MDNVEGVIILVELVWKLKFVIFNGLLGEYKFGVLYFMVEVKDICSGEM